MVIHTMHIMAHGVVPKNEYGSLRKTKNGWVVCFGSSSVAVEGLYPELHLDEYKVIGQEDGSVSVIRYASLHQHTDNSIKDAIMTVPQLVNATEYAGAITDHGVMHGFLEFYKGMKQAGKKPIIGIEAYMSELDDSSAHRHVILLAKNLQGYKNLLKLTSESYHHFYYKPHITWEMLRQYHEGIICLSACLGGIIPKALTENRRADACTAIERFIEIFGKDDFYIEIQNHHIPEETVILPQLVALATEYGLKYVATTDAHYLSPEDRDAHQIVLCLRDDKKLDDPTKTVYNGEGYYMHTSEQMEVRFADYPEALDTSLEIADKCNVEIPLGDVNLPNYQFPKPFKNADEYMLNIAKEGFDTRFKGTPHYDDPIYKERFNYEADIITKMGFSAYFVIVWDFINYAKTQNIPVGPGRGSAAGSMIAYCMGITDMDPVQYNLLFERFLNPSRISMPDIDTDIGHAKRPQVIQYLVEKYGQENVCRIITFGTFAAKQSLKDVARVLGFPSSFGSYLSGMINNPKYTLSDALENIPEFQDAYQQNKDVTKVVNLAKRIEGRKRHASVHACFDKNTLITTDSGYKYISNIKIGDKVLTHRGRFRPVVNIMVTKSRDIHVLHFSNNRQITVTGNHPLLAVQQISTKGASVNMTCGWTQVSNLKVGDMVVSRTEAGIEFTRITRHTASATTSQDMYNLVVLDDSSYVANSIVAHNCGVVISPGPVSDYLPTLLMEDEDTGGKVVTSQVVMTDVEPLSLIKMDLLGLKNLSAIDESLSQAIKNNGITAVATQLQTTSNNIRFQDIPLNDRATYRMLAEGHTGAVFQLESPGMTKIIKDLFADIDSVPDEQLESVAFERLIAAVALYRPGPMEYIPEYIEGMRNPNKVHYDCPEEKSILESTYGILVYQEQLMQIAQRLAGYSLGDADLLRKACGKKKKELMTKEHMRFVHGDDPNDTTIKNPIPGCVKNGIPVTTAEHIWIKMAKFAEYAFNRSHAACYALLGYITAYLSCHYPKEFYAAMLNAFNTNTVKLQTYLSQAHNRGILILLPDIQTSQCEFVALKDGILFGLQGISGLKSVATSIVTEREANGAYRNLQDLYERIRDSGKSLDKAALNGLIYAGALRSFTDNKAALLLNAKTVQSDYKKNAAYRAMGQISLFENDEPLPLPVVPKMDTQTESKFEFEAIGVYLTQHPSEIYETVAALNDQYLSIPQLLTTSPSKQIVRTFGLVSNLKEFYTAKSGELMASFTLETKFASVPCVVFPRKYALLRTELTPDTVLCFAGAVIADNREDDSIQFSVQQIFDPDIEFVDNSRRIVVPIRNKEEQTRLQQFAKQHPGSAHITILTNGCYFYPRHIAVENTPAIIAELKHMLGDHQSTQEKGKDYAD